MTVLPGPMHNCPKCGFYLKTGGAPVNLGLSRRMRQCYRAIEALIAENDVSPSYVEIGKRIGTSSRSTVHRLVTALEDRGYLVRLKGRGRSIQLTVPKVLHASDG